MAKHKKQNAKSSNQASRGAPAIIGAIVVAVGAVAALLMRRRETAPEQAGIVDQQAALSGDGHVPTDLIGERHPGASDRAIDAFRPDPTAAVPAAEREALRPATLASSHAARDTEDTR